jgi:hypothetical protein
MYSSIVDVSGGLETERETNGQVAFPVLVQSVSWTHYACAGGRDYDHDDKQRCAIVTCGAISVPPIPATDIHVGLMSALFDAVAKRRKEQVGPHGPPCSASADARPHLK